MPLVKVVLQYSYGNKSTYIDYKYSNFNEFKIQITKVFPNLQLPYITYKMYWVENSGGGRFLINKGHYFDKYVKQSMARPSSNTKDTLSHHLLIELDTFNEQQIEEAITMKEVIHEPESFQSPFLPLTIPIDKRIPVNISRHLIFLNCITDKEWESIAKYSATTKETDEHRQQHTGVRCNGCGAEEIYGVRYKCIQCLDYNLCTICSVFRRIHDEHNMLKMINTQEEINQNLLKNSLQCRPEEVAFVENCFKIQEIIGTTEDTFSHLIKHISILFKISNRSQGNNTLEMKSDNGKQLEKLPIIPTTFNDEPGTSKSYISQQKNRYANFIKNSLNLGEALFRPTIQKIVFPILCNKTAMLQTIEPSKGHMDTSDKESIIKGENVCKFVENVRKSIENVNIKEINANDTNTLSGWTVITKEDINELEKSDVSNPGVSGNAIENSASERKFDYYRIAQNLQNQFEAKANDCNYSSTETTSNVLQKIPVHMRK